jgi:hypothetical protein
VNAQEQVVLRQTFIKVEEGNNYAEDLKEKFSKFAQARIDVGYHQSGCIFGKLWVIHKRRLAISLLSP